MSAVYDEVRDFILLHYILTQREEPFWRDARNVTLPDSLRESLALYDETGRLEGLGLQLFPETSYFCILSGNGRLPRRQIAEAEAAKAGEVWQVLRPDKGRKPRIRSPDARPRGIPRRAASGSRCNACQRSHPARRNAWRALRSRAFSENHARSADRRPAVLISVGRAALGPVPAERLQEIGRELDIPADFAGALPAALAHADVVHFGYEAGAGYGRLQVSTSNMYPRRARRWRPQAAPPCSSTLPTSGPPGKPDSGAVTRYTWLPCRTREEIEAKLQELIPAKDAANARACVLGLLSRIASLPTLAKLLLMEVEEPGYPRRSCDLNVYDAGVRMREISELVDGALRGFAVPPAQGRAVFDRASDRALGHLAGGIGRDGKEFVTVYFGVEAH